MLDGLRDIQIQGERLELFRVYRDEGLDTTEASRRSYAEAPVRYAAKVLRERLLTFCQIEGVKLSVEEFETQHPHIELGRE